MASMTGAVAAVLVARPLFAFPDAGQSKPQPMPSPNAPANENVPAGLDGANIPVRNGGPGFVPATWMEIRSDAQKLLEMATDFKGQIDHTNLLNAVAAIYSGSAQDRETR